MLRGTDRCSGVAEYLVAASDDLAARLMDLYADRDPVLQLRWQRAWSRERIATHEGMMAASAQRRGGMNTAVGMWQAAEALQN